MGEKYGWQSDEISMERSSDGEISIRSRRLYDNVFHHHPVKDILNSLFDIVLILDINRQAVFVNRALLSYFGLMGPETILGKRPGEIFHCIHATEGECGCGTSRFCTFCEAQRAIVVGLRGGVGSEACHITTAGGDALDFGVSTAPLQVDEDTFVLFVIKDISDQQRVEALEQVFFHDVLNVSSVIWGLSSLLKDGRKEKNEDIGRKIYVATHRLISEIEAQRNLIWAEHHQLIPNWEQLDSIEILLEQKLLYEEQASYHQKVIAVDPNAEKIRFEGDRILLSRMIENLLKNALEAVAEGATVQMGCRKQGDCIEFWIHNEGVIPPEVRPHLFKRGYSTKSKGRGLGMYSVRLISERYLQGQVSYESTPESGTTVHVSYPLIPRKEEKEKDPSAQV